MQLDFYHVILEECKTRQFYDKYFLVSVIPLVIQCTKALFFDWIMFILSGPCIMFVIDDLVKCAYLKISRSVG